MADKMIVAMEAMGKDLSAAGTDCAKGAAALKAHTATLQAIAAEAKKFDQRDPAVNDWLKATYGARMLSAMGGMVELSKSCATDATFRAASEEFGKAMDM